MRLFLRRLHARAALRKLRLAALGRSFLLFRCNCVLMQGVEQQREEVACRPIGACAKTLDGHEVNFLH